MPANTAAAERAVSDAWSAVVRDFRSLTVGVTAAGIEMTTRWLAPRVPDLPGLPVLRDRWTRTQDTLTRELKIRLDRLEAPPAHPHSVRAADRRSPIDLLDDLLEPGGVDPESARAELYRALLLRLVPDEARLLATLATRAEDPTTGCAGYPLVHVCAKDRVVLANVTTAGAAARLGVPEATGIYVAHLVALGLAEEAPRDESLGTHYDILVGGDTVVAAERTARAEGRSSRVLRRTLRISPLGRALWAASRIRPPG